MYIKFFHRISVIRNFYSSFYVRLSSKLMLALIIRSNVGWPSGRWLGPSPKPHLGPYNI